MMHDDTFYDETPIVLLDGFKEVEPSFPTSVESQSSSEFTGVTGEELDSNENGKDKMETIGGSTQLQSLYYSTENDALELKNLLNNWNMLELFDFFQS